MKKIFTAALVIICVLGLIGCASRPEGATDLIELGEVSAFVSEKGYTGEDFKNELVGQFNEDIIHSWGEPDGKLSGFWGDRWYLDDDKTRFITLYYDEKGYVKEIVVGDDDVVENVPSLTGVVKEVSKNWLLIECEATASNPWTEYNVSLNVENHINDFNIGDEVVVYYDGNIAETTPLEIGKVYAITLKTPVNNKPTE